MTITVLPMDADPTSHLPAYSAMNERQALAALYGNPLGSVFGGRSGWRVGTPQSILSVTSTQWTLNPCSAFLSPAGVTYQGMYGWSTDQAITGAMTAADDANPRIDILYIQVNDNSSGDGSGALTGPVTYQAGIAAPSGTQTAPPLPVRSFLVATIAVPTAGSGSPTITLNKQFFTAAGAPVPVFSKAERDAFTQYDGLEVIRIDAMGVHQRSIGGKWLGGEHAEFTGGFAVTAGTLWGPGPLAKTTAASFCDDLITSPTNDQITVPPGVWDIHWRPKFCDAANIANGKNIADSVSFLQILDTGGNELTSRDLNNGKSSDAISIQEVYFPTGGTFQLKLDTTTTGLYTKSTIRVGRSK